MVDSDAGGHAARRSPSGHESAAISGAPAWLVARSGPVTVSTGVHAAGALGDAGRNVNSLNERSRSASEP